MNANLPQYIEIRQNRAGQDRPFIVGTRVRVQDIAIDHERFGYTAEEIAGHLPHLSLSQIHAALAYFYENREAVWQCLREDAAFVDRMRLEQEAAQASKPVTPANVGRP